MRIFRTMYDIALIGQLQPMRFEVSGKRHTSRSESEGRFRSAAAMFLANLVNNYDPTSAPLRMCGSAQTGCKVRFARNRIRIDEISQNISCCRSESAF